MLVLFEAFSKTKNRVVNVEEEYDLNEIFYCPNSECNVPLKIKSPSGKKRKHFAKLKNHCHIEDCPYDKKNKYQQSMDSNFNKLSVEDIFNNRRTNQSAKVKDNTKTITANKHKAINIATPLQLYKFCIQNSLDTVYLEDIVVNDIIVDYRNLIKDKLYFGIEGLRLVVAKTYRYSLKDNSIMLYLNSEKYTLHLTIYLDTLLLNEVLKYIFDTYESFSGHTIAIMGVWEKESNFNSVSVIVHENHIMYKLK